MKVFVIFVWNNASKSKQKVLASTTQSGAWQRLRDYIKEENATTEHRFPEDGWYARFRVKFPSEDSSGYFERWVATVSETELAIPDTWPTLSVHRNQAYGETSGMKPIDLDHMDTSTLFNFVTAARSDDEVRKMVGSAPGGCPRFGVLDQLRDYAKARYHLETKRERLRLSQIDRMEKGLDEAYSRIPAELQWRSPTGRLMSYSMYTGQGIWADMVEVSPEDINSCMETEMAPESIHPHDLPDPLEVWRE